MDGGKVNVRFPPIQHVAGLELEQVMQGGLVRDWDLVEQVWTRALRDTLRVSMEGRPVLIAEKPYAPASDRHK